jgi:hypothetical protein
VVGQTFLSALPFPHGTAAGKNACSTEMLAPAELVREIHDTGHPLVIAVTGGGSGAIAALLQVPGASRTVLEATVPYSLEALSGWLGATPEHACSSRTARAMAMAAYRRGCRYVTQRESPRPVAGIGCTASLASDRPKRGDHRLFVALQTATKTREWSLVLEKGSRTREQEEKLATGLVLNAVAEGCDAAGRIVMPLEAKEHVETRVAIAPEGWQELLAGKIAATAASGEPLPPAGLQNPAIFSGAFDPLHAGHRRMAEIASRRLGVPVEFEISVANVDKPPLDFLAMSDRSAQFVGGETLWFTLAETFVKKNRIFPGATFVVGIDTLVRIGDACYYGHHAATRDHALAELAGQGCRFLVFGRRGRDGFLTLASAELPDGLLRISDEVPESDFREDVSSTELRASEH